MRVYLIELAYTPDFISLLELNLFLFTHRACRFLKIHPLHTHIYIVSTLHNNTLVCRWFFFLVRALNWIVVRESVIRTIVCTPLRQVAARVLCFSFFLRRLNQAAVVPAVRILFFFFFFYVTIRRGKVGEYRSVFSPTGVDLTSYTRCIYLLPARE